jgi:DNA-binding NarL/FixJ family response regulator
VIAIVDRSLGARESRAAVVQGAHSVLLEDDLERTVLPALRAVSAGLVVLSSEFGSALERPPLTPREKQVLALVVMGFSNQEIADQLVLSQSTVKSHLFSAYRRLGVRTRAEATVLITDPERGFGSGILTIPQD